MVQYCTLSQSLSHHRNGVNHHPTKVHQTDQQESTSADHQHSQTTMVVAATTTTKGAPTPAEEIERQHGEALKLLEQGLEPSVPRHRSEIPLEFKKGPSNQQQIGTTAVRPDSDEPAPEGEEATTAVPSIPVWSLRGQIDERSRQQLQDLFREGYNVAVESDPEPSVEKKKINKQKRYTADDVQSRANLWDEANAAVHNVRIVRPSHDAWGIKKVVLIFSDDFLLSTYEMPWWHSRSDIREAVQPILDVLEITPAQVVRLLLASLPPGVTIPVHHDTGEWVKVTHRIHVPILVTNPSRVLFRAGVTDNELERIDCSPGLVWELNNQCRHAVSNADTHHRVHLILDYVNREGSEPLSSSLSSPPTAYPRLRLSPGEVVFQTRRSVSRLVDKGRRPTPSYLILGAQKAGTTSLYEYLNQHPLVVRARRRETHCFDWRWNESLSSVHDQREWCRKFYLSTELERHPSLLTGDSTPSYLLDSRRVIPRLQRVFNWPLRFLVLLRDPVKRAESQYVMVTSPDGTPEQLKARGMEWRSKSLREVVADEVATMQRCGLIPYFDVISGKVDEAAFAAFAGSSEEDVAWDQYMSQIPLHTGSHGLLGRGLYALNVRPWMRAFPREQFLVLNLDDVACPDRLETNVLPRVWEHLGIPPISLKDAAPHNQRLRQNQSSSLWPDDLREYVRRFFAPHNRRLEAELGVEWRDVWSGDVGTDSSAESSTTTSGSSASTSPSPESD